MGLDISVISNLEPFVLPEGMEPWSEEYDKWINGQDIPEYKEVLSMYQAGHWGQDRYGDYPPGVYLGEITDGFRAGSYSGYGEWRDTLAKVGAGFAGGSEEAWRHDGEDYPFEQLINYSDAEGYIAAPVTDKLCSDFVSFEKEVKDVVDKAWLKIHPTIELTGEDKDWFLAKWEEWKNAMCDASQDGAVMWH